MRSWAEVGGSPTHEALRAPKRPNSKSLSRTHLAGGVPTLSGLQRPFGNHPRPIQEQPTPSKTISRQWKGTPDAWWIWLAVKRPGSRARGGSEGRAREAAEEEVG